MSTAAPIRPAARPVTAFLADAVRTSFLLISTAPEEELPAAIFLSRDFRALASALISVTLELAHLI